VSWGGYFKTCIHHSINQQSIIITMTSENGNKDSAVLDNDFGPNVHVSSHPILTHKITKLRSSATPPAVFRDVLRELTYHLGYEATRRLTTRPVAISVPVPKTDEHGNKYEDHVEYTGYKLKEEVALIPIMRSGLGMTDSMLELLPNAAIHHIGMYKILGQHPVQYFNRLPRKCEVDVAYILDPVISTSSTVMSLIAILKKVRCDNCIRLSIVTECLYLHFLIVGCATNQHHFCHCLENWFATNY
jgi:uracil phosphoribosyltransferase